MSRVDVSHPPAFRRKDTETTGDASVRPTDDDYLRYACLVKAIADDDFGPGAFAVYDPMFSAILARAEDDLAWLAEQTGQTTDAAARADKIRQGLRRHLWNGTRYRYHDAVADERIESDVIGCYLPRWCGLEAGDMDLSGVRFGLPSCAPGDPAFDARRYWRGPTWINVNWLMIRAAGDEALKERTLALIAEQGFREYYNPITGEGLGAEQFTWTASLALDLMVS